MRVTINGESIDEKDIRTWLERSAFTGALAPDVVGPWYDSTTTAMRVVAQTISVTFIWKVGSDTATGDIAALDWVPANTKKARLLLHYASMSGGTGRYSVQENTGTLGAPTYTSRFANLRIPEDGTHIVNWPDYPSGLTGNGVGTVFRFNIEAISAGTMYAGFLGYEA